MSCYSGPGVTHYAGCDCWNESIRAQAYAGVAKRLQFAEERRAALFVKAHLDRRAAAGELKKLRAEVVKARARNEVLKEALQHCVDIGPPCPSCGAEDEETEDAGIYPHADDCLAYRALSARLTDPGQ